MTNLRTCVGAVVASAAVLVACPKGPDTAPVAVASPPRRAEADAYAVYRVVADRVAREWESGRLVIVARTYLGERVGAPDAYGPCGDWELAKRFLEQRPRTLDNHLGLDIPVHLLDERQEKTAGKCPADAGDASERWNWQCFWARYPGSQGILRVSDVVFDKSKARALVYAEFSCGYGCGRGVVYLLEHADGDWSIKNEHLVLMS